jgi:hypothetical protein
MKYCIGGQVVCFRGSRSADEKEASNRKPLFVCLFGGYFAQRYNVAGFHAPLLLFMKDAPYWEP